MGRASFTIVPFIGSWEYRTLLSYGLGLTDLAKSVSGSDEVVAKGKLPIASPDHLPSDALYALPRFTTGIPAPFAATATSSATTRRSHSCSNTVGASGPSDRLAAENLRANPAVRRCLWRGSDPGHFARFRSREAGTIDLLENRRSADPIVQVANSVARLFGEEDLRCFTYTKTHDKLPI